MLDEDGDRIVAEAAARKSPCVIDYEHATLHAKKTGTAAPAAGWYSRLEWRPGDGLWAVDVDWTALAAQMIVDKEYRFISPVFSFNPTSGRVLSLMCAALTNDPGIDGLADLAALAASLFLDQPTEETAVNEELLEKLRWLLNLPVGATAEDVVAQLQKLIDQINASGTAAASFDLVAHLKEQGARIAALSAQATPDPERFVPLSSLQEVQTALAALTAQANQEKVDALIASGRASGKLVPSLENWARDLGKQNVAALSAYLDGAAPVVTPGATQTGGLAPSGGTQQLSESQLAICSATGVSPEAFLATLQAETGA